MRASEKTYRLYSCGRCATQVRICRDCDRGNRYFAKECAQIHRRESFRRAARRYQQSYRGACKHAARQRALRKRHAQKVTHQGSLASASLKRRLDDARLGAFKPLAVGAMYERFRLYRSRRKLP